MIRDRIKKLVVKENIFFNLIPDGRSKNQIKKKFSYKFKLRSQVTDFSPFY